MEFPDFQDSDESNTNRHFPHRKLFTTRKSSMPTLFQEIKPGIRSSGEILVRNLRKIKNEMFSLEVSDYQDTDAGEKNNDFFDEYSSKGAVFSIDILMEKIKLVVADS